ncbi:MAG: DegV family protein [Clostridia bacterium]|jgi:DegV family protein with EDD domain|nr:DegV family protein [Clostridia bacterium]MCI9458882.1 DegV family protein [Clostridia bacterium]
MNDYLIFTDASADLVEAIADENGVQYIEMPCASEDGVFNCTGRNTDEEFCSFYEGIRTGELPKTTQITPFTYEEIATPYLKDGKSVLYLSLSSGLSSTFEAACLAAENLNGKFGDARFVPIDSIGATGSMGILVERMIENRKNGLSIDDNKADIEQFKHKMYTTCYVDDLKHLRRGGRIGAATAVIGAMLNIKPIIRITEDGKLESCGKPRGERKAITFLSDVYKEKADLSADSPIYISDADNDEMAGIMESEIKAINPNAIIRRRRLSPIIGTHLGPESVVIAFVKK